MTQQQHIVGSTLGGQPRFVVALPLLPLPLYLPPLPGPSAPRSGA
jgi:hypothetical protein